MPTNYPTSLDVKGASLFDIKDVQEARLTQTLTSSQTTIFLDSIALFPSYGGIAWVENEMIKYTGTASDAGGGGPRLTGVTRGFGGTTAATHATNLPIQNRLSSEHINNLVDAVIAIETLLGTNGSAFASSARQVIAGTGLTGGGPLTADVTLAIGAHTHQSSPQGGQLDHGLALTGLGDDDHQQYALADKSRPAVWVSATDLAARSIADLGTKSHSLLTGLTSGDDHTQYVHVSTARTITAVHTFNPGVTGAAFIVGANALDQLITGLNADLLDGQHGTFYRDAGNLNAGTLADARLSTNVMLLDASQVITAAKTFGSGHIIAPDIGPSASQRHTIPSVASDTIALLNATQTLAGKTLTTPTIASFINAGHNHQDAAGGGTLDAAAIATGTLNDARLSTSVVTLTGTQTLSNKTLTAPAISGTMLFESDTNLYRVSADNLATDDSFSIIRTASGATGLILKGSGQSDVQLTIDTGTTGGKIHFGPGNAATDVILYRSAADVLKTDDAFHIVGNLGLIRNVAYTWPTTQGGANTFLRNDGSGTLTWATSTNTITVRKNTGADVGTRPRLNLIEGSNIVLTVADDSTDGEVDITIAASGSLSAGGWTEDGGANKVTLATASRQVGIGVDTITTGYKVEIAQSASEGASLLVAGKVAFKDGTSFIGSLAHAITTTRTWTFPDRNLTVGVADDLTGTIPASTLGGRSLADLGTRSASDLNSGTLPDARLSANVVTLNATQVLTQKTLSTGTALGANLNADGNKITGLAHGTAAGEAVHAGRQVQTGAGLTGGGDLTADRTLVWSGLAVQNNATAVGTRRTLNFIPGSNITYTITDNATDGRVDVTITASSSSGGWTDDGTVVRLTEVTDQVGIGTATPDSGIKIHSTGDILSETALVLKNSGFKGSLVSATLGADRTWTFPNATGEVLIDAATQTMSNKTLGSNLAAGGFKITGLAQGTASGEAVHAGRTITAGPGLSGGGDLTSDRTISLDASAAGGGLGFSNGVIFVGSGNGITVSADLVAIDGSAALTWTNVHTWNPGTSQATALLLDMAQPGAAGQRDSHYFQIRGTSFDTAGHNADWRVFVDVTSNAGASSLVFQSRVDSGSFTTRFSITDAGQLTQSGNLQFQAGGSFTGTITSTMTANRTWTLPDVTDTIVTLTATQTLTNKSLTAPAITGNMTYASTTVVTNLNADMLDGNHAAFFQDASNINAGVLAVARGGTGLSTLTTGGVLFAGGTSTITQDGAQFFWDNTGKELGIGTAAPAAKLTVASGTITSAASPTILATATWNSGTQAFAAIRANVTDTASAATAKLLDLQVGGTTRFDVDKFGTATIATPTLTAAEDMLLITSTWNAAVTFNAIKVNITNTSSGASSTLLDLQVASVSKFAVTPAGDVNIDVGTVTLADPKTGIVGSATARVLGLDIQAGTSAFATTAQTGEVTYVSIGQATLTNPAAGTIANAATLKIVGALVASTNVTITNNRALWVAAGLSEFDGAVQMDSTVTVSNTGTFNLPVRADTTTQGDLWISTTTADTLKFRDSAATRSVVTTDQTQSLTNKTYSGTTLTLSNATANTLTASITGPSVTSTNTTSLLELAYTWNGTGAPTALKVNVTDTASGATSKLLDLQIGAVSRFNVVKTGAVNVTTSTLTAAEDVFAITSTWNGSGVTFNGIKINVTNTASAAASTLIDLQVASVSKFKVDVAGDATFGSGLITNNLKTGIVGSATARVLFMDFVAGTSAFATTAQTGEVNGILVGQATLTNPAVGTITNAASLKIVGAPVASTNVTITNNRAFWIAAGLAEFDGAVQFDGGVTLGSNVTGGGFSVGTSGSRIGTLFATSLDVNQTTVNVGALTLVAAGNTSTNATTMFDLSTTWNGTGSATAFKFNVTNTASGATAKVFDWQISAASVLVLDKFGTLALTPPTLTAANDVISITNTWNAGAATFNAIKVNITNTASAAASTLLDLQVGGSSKFKVDVAGDATFGAGLISNNLKTGIVGSATARVLSMEFVSGTSAFATTAQTGEVNAVLMGQATLTNPAAGTIANAATLKITGAPIASTNVTITNTRALWVAAGLAQFDGTLLVGTAGTFRLPIKADGSPSQGDVWLSTTTADTLKFRDASNIRSIVTTDQNQTLTNKTLTAPLIQAPQGQTATFTASGTIGANDTVVFSNANGITLTLPSASSNAGRIIWVIRIDSGATAVTIQRAGTDTVNGGTSVTLAGSGQYRARVFFSSGGGAWYSQVMDP